MHYLRKAEQRGTAEHGWLSSHHTFSFAEYYDPKFMGFSALRVINDDRVAQAAGFGRHPHKNMEIVSYVISGALEHKDSLGNGSLITPGDVQVMHAGTGISHSEYNHSKLDPVHFLQVWILPDQLGGQPGYEQKSFSAERSAGLALVASPDGREGSLRLDADVNMYASVLTDNQIEQLALKPGRCAWIQVAEGELTVNGVQLSEGDGIAFLDEAALSLSSTGRANILLFEMKTSESALFPTSQPGLSS